MFECINGWTKEKMIEHIKKEFKGKSYKINQMNCMYRGPDGKKCAVGMFIPDDAYNPNMEGKKAIFIEQYCPYNINSVMPLYLYQMAQLQIVHDHSNELNTLKDMLNWIERNVR